MLKIPKIKKKKKGKKKKDQELFTEEELEKYKEEQRKKLEEAQNAQQEDAQQSGEPSAAEPSGNDEEWSKFAQLTSGVDAIVKKTHDDLDRIKTTSFFQRVAPKVDEPKRESDGEDEETKTARQIEALKNAVVELSESEYESDEDTSIFDTEFMESGDIPIIIPDSPIEDKFDDSIFDTSYADKIIKAEQKKIIIGPAVEVLTGMLDAKPQVKPKRRPRRGIQNLMMDSFEEPPEPAGDGEGKGEAAKTSEPEKDPLDSLFDLPPEEQANVEIDLSVSMHLQFKVEEKKEEGEGGSKENGDTKVEENFDLKELDPLAEDEDDEFAQLAAESLSKPAAEVIKVVEIAPLLEPKPPEDTSWIELEKPEEPDVPIVNEFEIDIDLPNLDDDPFNTEFVETIIPKSDSFDESFDEIATRNPKEKSAPPNRPPPPKSPVPIRPPPPTKKVDIVNEFNLLDTDDAPAAAVATSVPAVPDLLDDDNPMIEITEPDSNVPTSLAERKSSLSLSIHGANKAVSFDVPTPDPMKTEIEFSALIKKPLTPYYPEDETEESNVDPFDTSFVGHTEPTQLELNYLEQEMLKNTLSDLEDPDFDPRAPTPEPPTAPAQSIQPVAEPVRDPTPEPEFDKALFADDKYQALALINGDAAAAAAVETTHDILTDPVPEVDIPAKILMPRPSVDSFEVAEIDPFDTAFAANIRPGDVEIKIIESELIQ